MREKSEVANQPGYQQKTRAVWPGLHLLSGVLKLAVYHEPTLPFWLHAIRFAAIGCEVIHCSGEFDVTKIED